MMMMILVALETDVGPRILTPSCKQIGSIDQGDFSRFDSIVHDGLLEKHKNTCVGVKKCLLQGLGYEYETRELSRRMPDSRSEQLRKTGNEFYRQAVTSGSIAPVLQKSRLLAAIRCYNQALNENAAPGERASCYKNLGISYWKLIEMSATHYSSGLHSTEEEALIGSHMSGAVQSHSDAFREGENSKKTLAWMQTTQKNIESSVEAVLDSLDNVKYVETRIRIFRHFCLALWERYKSSHCERWGKVIARVHIKYSTEVSRGISNIEDYWPNLTLPNALEEIVSGVDLIAARSLEAAKTCLNIIDSLRSRHIGVESFDAVERDIHVLRESFVSKQTAWSCLRTVLAGFKILSASRGSGRKEADDSVWDAIDKFKQAETEAKGADMNGEGTSLHALGQVYTEVLHNRQKGRSYYVKSIKLGEHAIERQLCIRPPVWYEASRKELHASDTESIKEAEEEAEARRIMLEEVAAVVRQLEEKAKEGKFQFLEYLYKTHPPKQTKFKNHTLRRDDTSKKIITIAIRQSS